MNVYGSEINFDLNDEELKEEADFLQLLISIHPVLGVRCSICVDKIIGDTRTFFHINNMRCVKINDVVKHVCKECDYSFKCIKCFDNDYDRQYLIPQREPHQQRECWCFRCMKLNKCKEYVYDEEDKTETINNKKTNDEYYFQDLVDGIYTIHDYKVRTLHLCNECRDTLFPSHA